MKIIQFDEITKLGISPIQCFDWVSDALKRKKEVILPAKISLKTGQEGVFYNTMPVIIPFLGRGGLKLVTRYPSRLPSLESQILLYDLKDGSPLAIMDGTWITAMRTGAVAAHSIQLLAKRDFSTLGFIGLGNTARCCMSVLLSLYPDRPLVVKLKKYKDQHELFAKRFSSYKNVIFQYCDSYDETVKGSDVIVSAVTFFDQDICKNESFDKGVLLVPIHTRGFTNCDLFFDKIFADDVNHVKGFKYFSQYKSFAETASVIDGSAKGRENDEERIIAYNIGIALHDIYFASKIYDLLGDIPASFSLDVPNEKFWC